MRAFTFAVHIDRPPESVWDFMMDRRNSPRWNNLVRKAEVVTPGPVRVGSQILVQSRTGFAQKLRQSRLRAYGSRLTARAGCEYGRKSILETP